MRFGRFGAEPRIDAGGVGFSDTEKLRTEFLEPAPDRACVPAGRREYCTAELFADADKFNRRKFRGAVQSAGGDSAFNADAFTGAGLDEPANQWKFGAGIFGVLHLRRDADGGARRDNAGVRAFGTGRRRAVLFSENFARERNFVPGAEFNFAGGRNSFAGGDFRAAVSRQNVANTVNLRDILFTAENLAGLLALMGVDAAFWAHTGILMAVRTVALILLVLFAKIDIPQPPR